MYFAVFCVCAGSVVCARGLRCILLRTYPKFEAHFCFCHLLFTQFKSRWYSQVFVGMPESLQRDVSLELYQNWITRVPFLNAADTEERSVFVSHLSTLIEEVAFPAETVVVNYGVECHAMYIITKGIAVQISKYSTSTMPLPVGSYFGTHVILANGKHEATVRSITFLFCIRFAREAFDTFLQQTENAYPQTHALIRRARLKMALKQCISVVAAYCRALRMIEGHGQTAYEYKEYKKFLIAVAHEQQEKSNKRPDKAPLQSPELKLEQTRIQAAKKASKKLRDELKNPLVADFLIEQIENSISPRTDDQVLDFESCAR